MKSLAKRIFESEKGPDMLMTEYTKRSGVKIGKFYNNCVLCWFLPESQALNVEASFILQEEEHGELNMFLLKQSISRGITWLGQYPVKDCSVLQSILLYFTCAPFLDPGKDPRNDYVKDMFNQVEQIIKDNDPSYTNFNACIANFGDDICKHWDVLWDKKIAYDVLSSIVFLFDPQKEITWYDGIVYLKAIEDAAKKEHGVK